MHSLQLIRCGFWVSRRSQKVTAAPDCLQSDAIHSLPLFVAALFWNSGCRLACVCLLFVEVAKNALRPLGIPEISTKKAKQERRLGAYAGKELDWHLRLDPLHLRPDRATSGVGQVVFQKNAVYMQSRQKA
jgi:hypothetical protein